MYSKTKLAVELMAREAPYLYGQLPVGDSWWIECLKFLRYPMDWKFFLTFFIPYVLLAIYVTDRKIIKNYDWTSVILSVIAVDFLLVIFENYALKLGYWNYPENLYYLDDLPLIGSWMPASPVISALLLYPIGAFVPFCAISMLHKRFLEKDEPYFKKLNIQFYIATIYTLALVLAFYWDFLGLQSENAYGTVLGIYVGIIAMILSVLRKANLGLSILKASLFLTVFATVIEIIGCFGLMSWVLDDQRSSLGYFNKFLKWPVIDHFNNLLKPTTIDEYLYYALTAALSLTFYSFFNAKFYQRRRSALERKINAEML